MTGEPRMTLNDWLEPRLEGAPPELAVAIRELVRQAEVEAEVAGGAPRGVPVDLGRPADPGTPVDRDEAPTIPARLAEAALHGFDAVLAGATAGRRSHDAALRLLAADASLTYAFEAAADLELDAIGLANRLGPRGALGLRLASAPGRPTDPTPEPSTDPAPDPAAGGSS